MKSCIIFQMGYGSRHHTDEKISRMHNNRRVTKKSTILNDHNNRSIQLRIEYPLYVNPIGLFVLHLARYIFENNFFWLIEGTSMAINGLIN